MCCVQRKHATIQWHYGPKRLLLTHWGQVMHICISKLNVIGSDNGLSPGRCQAIIWTNVEILLIVPLETNFCGILIKIHTFSFKKMYWKMLYWKWRPFCLNFNVLSLVMLNSFHEKNEHFPQFLNIELVQAMVIFPYGRQWMAHISCIAITMDDLVMQEARVSAAMVLTCYPRIFWFQHQKILI